MLPNDPVMLLSFINTQLRDFYSTLDELCEDLSIDKVLLEQKLGSIDYHYNADRNQFI